MSESLSTAFAREPTIGEINEALKKKNKLAGVSEVDRDSHLAKLTQTTEALEILKNENEMLESKCTLLMQERNEQTEIIDQQQNVVKILTDEKQFLENRVKELDGDRDVLAKVYEEFESEKASLSEALQVKSAELGTLNAQVGFFSAKIAELTEAKTTLEQKVARTSSKYEASVNDYEDTISRLTAERDAAQSNATRRGSRRTSRKSFGEARPKTLVLSAMNLGAEEKLGSSDEGSVCTEDHGPVIQGYAKKRKSFASQDLDFQIMELETQMFELRSEKLLLEETLVSILENGESSPEVKHLLSIIVADNKMQRASAITTPPKSAPSPQNSAPSPRNSASSPRNSMLSPKHQPVLRKSKWDLVLPNVRKREPKLTNKSLLQATIKQLADEDPATLSAFKELDDVTLEQLMTQFAQINPGQLLFIKLQ